MTTVQAFDVTATTDADGYFTFSFPAAVNQVSATPVSNPGSFLGVNVQITGLKSVKVRCWASAANWSVQPLAHTQVDVTLIGYS